MAKRPTIGRTGMRFSDLSQGQLITSLGLGLGRGVQSGDEGTVVIAPEDFGVLARSIDADTLVGADGSGVSSWPNVSTDAPAVPGYVQADVLAQPILGTVNGHRFVRRSGSACFMTTASNFDMLDTRIFIVAQVVADGTSLIASLSGVGANSKIEAKGTSGQIGPRAVSAAGICGNTLDRAFNNDILAGKWLVHELYLPAGLAGAYLAIDGTIVDTTTTVQSVAVPMDSIFSQGAYTGSRADPAIALMRVYSLSAAAMSPADVIGARALMQARADALNGV